tara:strand:- start:6523 stop:7794 length:1272 start_codon:yes stop_codon:yes gene_type:complete
MGFERGYLHLADKLLPGLTNVADRPRYFSVLCAGTLLAKVDVTESPRRQAAERLQGLLRFERLWALANVMASRRAGDSDTVLSGIRGVTYAISRANSLEQSGASRTDASFPLLSRQVPYGAVGIYGAVADGMRFLDRRLLVLTPDLGERLGQHFVEATNMPPVLQRAVKNGSDVSVRQLADWGERAHIVNEYLPVEQDCFREALHRDPVRSRMAECLEQCPVKKHGESELNRLGRIVRTTRRQPLNRDLYEAGSTVLAFEETYRLILLGFERLLWLCRNLPAASVTPADINSDSVLQLVSEQLPDVVGRLCQAADSATSEQFCVEQHRLNDVLTFVREAATACDSRLELVESLIQRHTDVQRGKFDQGRRKMPWLERVGDRISLTMTRVGGLNREATSPDAVRPHEYRLPSADALIASAEGRT